jgi:sugar-specific transcriptional regulator TrmB
MSRIAREGARHLTALGFTELEADVYIFLLSESPVTGYRVAQAIGRTAANTYKALESLASRGAIMVEAGAARLCRAVPPEELLRNIETEFAAHRQGAQAALERIGSSQADDRVYQLHTPAQVYERARSLIDEAQHVVLVDLFPGPLEELRPVLAEAAARGVRVGVLAYESVEIDGVMVVLNYQAPTVRDRWRGHWVNVVVDAAQHVVALLAPDAEEVQHATWSTSAFLTHLYHSGLLGEISTSLLRSAIHDDQTRASLASALRDLDALDHTSTPAFTRLVTDEPRRGSARRLR